MRFLLDTNVWLRFFHFPQGIKVSVRTHLLQETSLGLSTFSLVEVAQKNAKSPAGLGVGSSTVDWFERALPERLIQLIPITPEIAAKAYDLGESFQGDPADRIIAATAIVRNLTLVTSDKKLISSRVVKTIPTR